MAMGVVTDIVLCAPLLGIGIWSLSLTLFADALRACLLTLLELFVLVTLLRIHRQRLPSYQYGFGKIEHFLNLLIGTALLLASLWVFGLGALSLLRPPPAWPFGLLLASVVSTSNVVQNGWMLVIIWRAAQDGTSIIIDGQVRTRLLKFLSSLMATLAILVSAVFAGRQVGLLADLFGSAVVVAAMIGTAARLIAAGLPDLLDRMLDEPQQAAINAVLIHHFAAFDLICYVRNRRSGNAAFVEIGLGYYADRHMGDVDAVNQAVMREVEALIPGAKVSVVATACPREQLDQASERRPITAALGPAA
jgi:divalent metal cation (Fe/Co/Zn/Cd) transporter